MLTVLLALVCNVVLRTPDLKVGPTIQVRPQVEPLVPIGIWYGGPGAQPPEMQVSDLETVKSELAIIRRAGFNSITTWVTWRDAEPKRGAYVLAGVERLIALAAQSDLRVDVRIFTDTPPAWSSAVPGDRARFITYAVSRLRLSAHITSVEAADGSERANTIRVGRNARTPIEARVDFWTAIARGAQTVTFMDAEGGVGPSVLSLGETIGIVTRNPALFAPLRVRMAGIREISGGSGPPVEVRLLESPDALVILGINFSPNVQKTTINFTPDIPEAIWQNLETSTSVNFVMGPNGPFLEHTFSPRDTLVLMIRKKLR